MAAALKAWGQRWEHLAGLGDGGPWTHSCTRRDCQTDVGTENIGSTSTRPLRLRLRRVAAEGPQWLRDDGPRWKRINRQREACLSSPCQCLAAHFLMEWCPWPQLSFFENSPNSWSSLEQRGYISHEYKIFGFYYMSKIGWRHPCVDTARNIGSDFHYFNKVKHFGKQTNKKLTLISPYPPTFYSFNISFLKWLWSALDWRWEGGGIPLTGSSKLLWRVQMGLGTGNNSNKCSESFPLM